MGQGKWKVRVAIGSDADGRQRYLVKTVSGTVSDAKRVLTDFLKRKDEGRAQPLSRDTLDVWTRTWLAEFCKRQSARTRAGYEEYLDRYLTPELRVKRLSAISLVDVQRWVNQLVDRGLAPRTVRGAHAVLRKALSDAVRAGKIGVNVAKGVALPKLDHREMQSLTPQQVLAFLAAAEGTRYHALFVVWVHTGLRNAELAALKWEDFDGVQLKVRRAFVRVNKTKRAIGPTKTGRPRLIPLAQGVVQVLDRHRREQAAHKASLGDLFNDQGYIFTSEYGSPVEFQNIRGRFFKPLLARLGLPDIRLYDLRHTCATLLLSAGENIKVVSDRLGHAKIALTLDTYAHLLPGQQMKASERLEALLRIA